MQIKQENDGHAVIDQLTGEEVLTCAINIGEQLLMSGAEISRVEDTISGKAIYFPLHPASS